MEDDKNWWFLNLITRSLSNGTNINPIFLYCKEEDIYAQLQVPNVLNQFKKLKGQVIEAKVEFVKLCNPEEYEGGLQKGTTEQYEMIELLIKSELSINVVGIINNPNN